MPRLFILAYKITLATLCNLNHTSGIYLFGSGSLNSDLKNGNTLGDAVFNMSIKSVSKFPSKYKPRFHFSTSVQIPGMEILLGNRHRPGESRTFESLTMFALKTSH